MKYSAAITALAGSAAVSASPASGLVARTKSTAFEISNFQVQCSETVGGCRYGITITNVPDGIVATSTLVVPNVKVLPANSGFWQMSDSSFSVIMSKPQVERNYHITVNEALPGGSSVGTRKILPAADFPISADGYQSYTGSPSFTMSPLQQAGPPTV